MNELDKKINQHFPGLVVRKDLVKTVKGNAIVPSYVLEYLLGQYCATDDEESIQSGIQTVKEILAKHYVHRNEAGLIRSTIREKGRHKVIDKVTVNLNDKKDVYEAEILAEEKNNYIIIFYDSDMEPIKAKLSKKEFEGFPYELKQRTPFDIVIYQEKENTPKANAFPTEDYWNKELRGLND